MQTEGIRILQVIAPTAPAVALFNANKNKAVRKLPVELWALVEDETNNRLVLGMTSHGNDQMQLIESDKDFFGYELACSAGLVAGLGA